MRVYIEGKSTVDGNTSYPDTETGNFGNIRTVFGNRRTWLGSIRKSWHSQDKDNFTEFTELY